MSHARRAPGGPDFIGLVTFSGALGAIVYGLIKSSSLGWGSTTVLGCLIGGGVLLIVFLIAEAVQTAPLFDLSLFRKPTFVGGSVAAFALSAGLFALLPYITLYLQDILGLSALQAGLRLLVLSGGIVLTSTLAGRLTSHVPIRFLIGPGLALVTVGVYLMRGIGPTTGWTHLVPGFIVAGAGAGLINPRSPQPRSAWSSPRTPAWPPGSTRRFARSASRRVWRDSARFSLIRSERRSSPG
jgi:predicted MFS family arabinose efflux permease